MSDLLTHADRLYGLPLAEFTAARDALAKDLKATDPVLSAQLKALKKPTLAAWVVNLFTRRESEQVEQILTVGAALREAAAALDGEELRNLTRQRRQLTAAVTSQARGVAAEAGQRVTESVADAVEATLTAAMLSETAAGVLRTGLLVSVLDPAAPEEVAAALAVPEAVGFVASASAAPPPPKPALKVVFDADAEERELARAKAAAEARLSAAQAAVNGATGDAERAEQAVASINARTRQLQAEIDEHRRAIARLEEGYEQLDEDLADAEDSHADAQEALAAARREHAEAKSELVALLAE